MEDTPLPVGGAEARAQRGSPGPAPGPAAAAGPARPRRHAQVLPGDQGRPEVQDRGARTEALGAVPVWGRGDPPVTAGVGAVPGRAGAVSRTGWAGAGPRCQYPRVPRLPWARYPPVPGAWDGGRLPGDTGLGPTSPAAVPAPRRGAPAARPAGSGHSPGSDAAAPGWPVPGFLPQGTGPVIRISNRHYASVAASGPSRSRGCGSRGCRSRGCCHCGGHGAHLLPPCPGSPRRSRKLKWHQSPVRHQRTKRRWRRRQRWPAWR